MFTGRKMLSGRVDRRSFIGNNETEMEVDLLKASIPHLFLPKKTPQLQQSNLTDIDQFLLQNFSDAFKSLLTEVPFPQLNSITDMFEKWSIIYPTSGDYQFIEIFCHEAKALKNGGTLPIYVRKQNSTLLITKRAETIELATFRSSLPGEMVMSTIGSHSLTFPETTETIINIDILNSEEFASQLHELSVGDIEISLGKTTKGGHEYLETRDVANPHLISDWIVGLLVPDPEQNKTGMTPQIRKKIRDQVTFTTKASGSLPFRRSGMYMSLKVALQLKIVENLDNNLELGKHVYKLVMLRILTDVASQLCNKKNFSDLDISAQILAKIGMRVRKLEHFKLDTLSTPASEEVVLAVTSMKDKCLKYTESTVQELKKQMYKFWSITPSEKTSRSNRNSGLKKPPVKIQTVDYSKDLEHEIPTLDSYLDKLKGLLSQSEKTDEGRGGNELQPVQRYLTAHSILSSSGSSYYSFRGANEKIWLYDTENYIKFQCTPNEDGASVSAIHQILAKYAEKAKSAYKNDPVGMSQLVLVTLKGFELLDKMTTSKYPLLLEYKLDVNPNQFEILLLPFQKDMTLLDELLKYFAERDGNAFRSGSHVVGRQVNADTFSVRFAKQDSSMKTLREKILADTEKEIEEKYKEIDKCREECKAMQEKINADICKCEYKTKSWRTKWGKWRYSRKKISTCEKCILESELEYDRESIGFYERKLPHQETFQWAVIFELVVPEEYATLRDFIAFFKYEILGERIFNGESNGNLSMKWLNYSKLSQYRQNWTRKLQLGSSSSPASNTYHTRTQNLNVLTYSNEHFIINNGMGCNFHYEKVGTPIDCVKTVCSFQLKHTSNSVPYANLQNALTSITHTQNHIIARQHECHEKLAFSEFITYGSLRAGHRIQLRNMYEAIFSGTLSLEQEPVLALILQTIWQVGPRNEKNERESHFDFQENEFATEFLDMLDKLVGTNEANYSNSQILLTAVLIARRIGDLNEDMHQTCYEKLRKWRTITEKWMKKILDELDNQDGKKIDGGNASLKSNLLDVILCSLLSYTISDPSKVESVMKDEQDIGNWLNTIFQYSRNINEDYVNTSEFMKTLLNIAKLVPLRLGLEEKIAKKAPIFEKALHSFICRQWNKAERLELKSITFSEAKISSVIFLEYQETDAESGTHTRHRLTFDVVRGSFLVNGFSQSTLPSEVKGNKLFQRYFKDVTYLRTQQDTEWVTTTVSPFHGKHYEFHQIPTESQTRNYFPTSTSYRPRRAVYYERRSYYDSSDDSDNYGYGYESPRYLSDDDDFDYDYDRSYSHSLQLSSYRTTVAVDLVIKEIQGDSSTFILLDPENFSNTISDFFTANYSHWVDPSKNVIYFRPDAPQLLDSVLPYEYILEPFQSDTKTFWKLKDTRTNEFILSVNSNGFKTATASLAKLEVPRYINIAMNQDNVRTTYLRRYNLRFVLKDGGNHESVEYPGFSVSANQYKKGTLIGLRQGLLLKNNIRQLLLVPHSSINIESGTSHQTVEISLKALRQPPCFVYEYDDVLKRLKAHNSKSAWLYLAALHASTSSPLPDPFTRVTGTEMAVGILQSACVWSCSPYDKESKSTLEFIKSLSPKRKYYGRSSPPRKKPQEEESGTMEMIEWPEGLPTMAAYDGFAIIVDTLLKESEKLEALHVASGKASEKEKPISSSSPSEKLRLRSYLRYLPMYNPIVAVENPNYFSASQLATVRANAGVLANLSIRQSSEKLNLNGLLVISTARLAKSMSPLFENGFLQNSNLTSFLLKPQPLDVPVPCLSLKGMGTFRDLLYLDFRLNWLKLYTMAINCKSEEEMNALTIILAAAVYRGAPLEQVANLHCISQCAFKGTETFPTVPCFEKVTVSREVKAHSLHPGSLRTSIVRNRGLYSYPDPTCNDYDNSLVENILKCHPKPFTGITPPVKPEYRGYYSGEETYEKYLEEMEKYREELEKYERERQAYLDKIKGSCTDISCRIKAMVWPCAKIENAGVGELIESNNIESISVTAEINKHLSVWYRNHKLKEFIEDVQSKLNLFYSTIRLENPDQVQMPILSERNTSVYSVTASGCAVTIEEILDESLAQKRDEAENIFKTGDYLGTDSVRPTSHSTRKQCCQQTANDIMNNFLEILTGSTSAKIMHESGIVPRLDPTSMLKNLLGASTGSSSNEQRIIRDYAGSLGVLWTHIMQCNRCIRTNNSSELERETSNPGHQNWSAAEHPEWLLLQLELDIMIRPVQVDVARQMMCMPNGGNGVTQLNMGEGKTSVIVPMLCATLAKKDSQLCRVTVLSSMFNMNLASLTFSIGRLLNRRVYSVPCRRDMQIDEECVKRIDQVYKECLNFQGVVLTLPEYRLSFRLLAYDKILKKETKLGLNMLGIENWLRNFARDVLDESDELFSVKYQLVYTIGEHVPIDGGDLRWITCQRLLEIVQKVGATLLKKYGTTAVECEQDKNHCHEFSTLRLLSNSYLDEFHDLVADQALEEFMLTKKENEIVKRFLIQQQIDREDYIQVMESIFQETPNDLIKFLLLSGYLKRGVLGLSLTKRWRVEYGVNPRQGFRRMAVPYRAKDVAAEKTEFGHPDLAIILTHLSYYYSGLSDAQCQETFDILKEKQSPDVIYSSWIATIPEESELTPLFLQKYKSLNMKDAGQRSALFDLLRKHKMVVDFWLSHSVLPRECKQFPGKLVMTAWDLCYERQRCPVTGFSGTNDSRILLPLMISQQDLPALQSTNQAMEQTLLQPENGNHKGFQMGVKCKEILETMKQDKLSVLIDAGALMLEKSNEQVAKLWLEVNPEIEAVVYFSKDNDMLVKCRGDQSQDTQFDASPYQGRLEKCGVFLDDQHTRGTDIKFPLGSKACVTVGTRMKRDKLIQACMRMRKLGQGHSVTFYLSHEALGKVMMQHVGDEITTKKVLDWVCKNTKESNEDGLLYWALAGRNYAQRLAAEDNYHFPLHETPIHVNTEGFGFQSKATILADQCVDDEVVKLKEMYGQFTQIELLTDLIPKWFAFTKLKLKKKNGGQDIAELVMKRFDEICGLIKGKCIEHVPERKHVSSSGMMEEEQEKELELEKETEVEEEREIEKPNKAEEAIPHLHPNVRNVVLNAESIQLGNGGIVRLCDIFRSTTFWGEVQPESWKDVVYATNDFVTVIKQNITPYHKTDDHLRPVQYMVSFQSTSESGSVIEQLLVVSPFEVNELMPHFRSGDAKGRLRMFSLRRTERQDNLLNNLRLQVPPAFQGLPIPDSSRAAASLLLASGSLYFISKEEQKAFVNFLGLVPQPWSAEEKEAIQEGMITKTGFLLPQFRKPGQSGFGNDPTALVKKILLCRHPVVSNLTHVMRLLEKKYQVEFPETG